MIHLIVLLFCSSLISQSLMDATATLVFLSVLYKIFKKKWKIPVLRLGLERLWPLWIIIVAIGLIWSGGTATPVVGSSEVWKKLLRLWEWHWILMFYALYWAFQKVTLLKKHSDFFWGILSISSLYALIDWYLHGPRAGGFFDDPMTFAHVYGQYFCFGFGLWIVKLNEQKSLTKKDFLLTLAIALSGVAVLLSLTRGVWGGCAVAMIVMTFVVNWKLGLILTTSLMAFAGLLFEFWLQFKVRILFFFSASQNYDSQRLALWKANWLMFKDHPFFGIGYGEYKALLKVYFAQMGLPPDQFASHAHNQYLHFLSATGILGLTCFLFFVFFNFKKTWLGMRESKNSADFKQFYGVFVGAFGAQICFLLSALTESNFERSKVKLVYLLISSVSLAYFAKMELLRGATRRDGEFGE